MRIAVVGSGIAGLASAWLLAREHDVVVFEQSERLGGHTHTHDVLLDRRTYPVDTGFIVFNRRNYPLLGTMFDELGVASNATTMSFSVQDARNGLEYNATNLAGLLCQRRNALSPAFWRMLRDIMRFYREADALLQQPSDITLGAFLEQNAYSNMFREDHIVPMASALWSSPASEILGIPLHHLLRFMSNHQMLQADGRPQWRVVEGGSQAYVRALEKNWRAQARPGCAVLSVLRDEHSVRVRSEGREERFDQVVMACHSDQTLALLQDASNEERGILGAMRYQANDVVLHTDARLLPKRRKAWAAWNAYVPPTDGGECTVSYCMNLLQSIDAPEPIVVTLNRSNDIDPQKIVWRGEYMHPLHDRASVDAQRRKPQIQGRRNTWFAGAYWGFGFHEDGMRSGVAVANALGVSWP
ncbi:MAG: FAD-dependent oxidoreductase [Rudaea sp.]